MIEIKSVVGRVLYSCEAADVRAALVEAVRRGADLSDANLSYAYLSGADLYHANLYCADLTGADLYHANLYCADLTGADLTGARNADLAIARTRILPDDGEITGWKKCLNGRIVKLRIPADAARSHGGGRKCRAAKAEVLAIFDKDGNPVDTAASQHDPDFVYRVGETVTPTEPFDTNQWNECAPGIHFYITRAEAEAHA